MKNTLALLALSLFTNLASAADAKNFKNLGFSADGRYYAFVESVIQDGSGYAQASAHVVDVANNSFAASGDVLLEAEYSSEKTAIDQAVAKLNLSHYGIDGKIPGRTLWMRFPTDLSAPTLNPVFSTNYYVDGGASAVYPRYELKLSEQRPANPDECYDTEGKMLTLTIKSADMNGGGRSVELQKDTRLPKSRECANSYQPRQVLQYKDKIVVVLRYFTQGFEGPDYNHMVVTGAGILE